MIWRRARAFLLPLVTVVAALVLVDWWTQAQASMYFPRPLDVFEEIRSTWVFDRAGTDLLPSLGRMFAGFLLGSGFGFAFGLFLALGPRWLERGFDPVIELFRAIPASAFLPLVIVVFGVGSTGKVLVIAFGAMFPVLINTIDGVREVEPLLYDVCASYNVRSPVQIIGRVVVPAAMPRVFAGVQVALALSLILMVISEMMGSLDGVGRFILEAQRTFTIRAMWGGIVILGLLGFALNAILRAIERRALRWHRATHGGGAV